MTLTIAASRFSFAPEASGSLTATVSGTGITGGADTVEVVSTPGAPITVGFDKSAYSFAEDAPAEGTVIELVATLDPAYPRVPADGAAFNVSTEAGTATFRVDFVTVNLAVTFSSGDFKPSADGPTARRNIGFALIDDDVYEGSENLVVKIEKSAGTPGDLARFVKPDGTAGGRYDVTIDDAEDAPALALTADPMLIAEEDDSATPDVNETVSTLTVAITNGKTYPDERTVTLTFAGDATKGTHYSVSPADTDTGTTGHQAVLGAGASSVSVTVTAAGNTTADENRSIVVSAALGDAEIGSATVTIVDDETTVDNNAADGKPVIEGVPQAGRTLTADVSRITDDDGLPDTFDYRWVRISSGAETTVGSSAVYTVTSADAGGTLRVEVSFTDDESNPEGPLASDPVPAVAALGTCPAHSEWSAVLTMGYGVVSGLARQETFGFRAGDSFGGLDPVTIRHGSTDHTVTRMIRNLSTQNNGNTVVSDDLSLQVSGGELPDGTVLNFGGTELTVGTDSDTGTPGQEQWGLFTLGFTPTWVGGQQMRLCANLPPKLESVTVGGTSLVLTYHEDLDTGSVPAPGDYMVTVGGSPGPAVTGVAMSGREVTLTLASAVGAGQTVTLEYTPGSNPVRDVSGIEALSFMGGPVDNKSNVTGRPEISGTAQVGAMLTADVSKIMDADGLPAAFDYRWVRISGGRETDIGTNASRYSPAFADVGSTIRVYVSFTDNADNPEGPVASDAVGPVAAAPAGTCPANSDWRATLTLGYSSIEFLVRLIQDFGFGTSTTADGSLNPATIRHGSTDYTVTRIHRSLDTPLDQSTVNIHSLTLRVSGGDLPDSTVLSFGGMALTVDEDSHSITDGQETWNLKQLALNPTWVADQELAACANLPPGLESATVEGTSLVLTYDQDLDTGSAPRPGAYLVTVDGMGRAVSGVEVSGARVTLTLAAAVANGQTVTVTYIPGSKPVRDGSRLNALGFAGQGVVVMDTIPPAPESAAVETGGNGLNIIFNEDLDIAAGKPPPPAEAFTVKADGVEVMVNAVAQGFGRAVLFLSLPDDAIRENRTVTVSYAVPATNPIQDAAGNRTVAFKDFTVDNNSTVDGTPPVPASAELQSGGNGVAIVFNEDLDIGTGKPPPPASAFTVKADGVEVMVNTVVQGVVRAAVYLSLPDDAIGQNQIVTVSYAVPATNPIQDAGGNRTVAFKDFTVTNNSTVANTTPPVPASAELESGGNGVAIVFNEDLDIGPGKPPPPASAFTVKADGVEVMVNTVVQGVVRAAVYLSLPTDAIGQNQIVTVSYAVPATNPIQDADGHKTLAFTDFPVTNNSTVANTTPPVPASGEVEASGDRLTLTFNEDLDNGTGNLPPASAFTVKADGAGVTVRSVGEGSGADSVVLSLSSTIIRGRTVTVTYTVPATNPIRDTDSRAAAAFTDFPVTNNSAVTVDTTAPEPQSAMVPAEGDQLLLTFDEDLDLEQADPVPPPGAFTVTVDGERVTVDGVTAVGNDTLVLSLPTDVKVGEGQTVLVGYTVPATGRIRDAAENETAAFSGFFVANNSTVDLTPPVPASAAVSATGNEITLTFSEDLDNGPGKRPPASAFTVKVDGTEVTVSSVAGTRQDQLNLGLPANAIRENRTVTVSYAVPATNPIQDAADNRTVAFTDFPVTNNSTVDGTPPVPASAELQSDGSGVAIVFNEDLDIGPGKPPPPASAFTVRADGVEVMVNTVVQGVVRAAVHLDLPDADAIGENQIVTVSYAVPATDPIRDAAGNKATAFKDFAVTNNSTVANTTPPVPASAELQSDGSGVAIVFNEDLDIGPGKPPPPASAFTVKADGVEVMVNTVVQGVVRAAVHLDLPDADAIGENQIVTVSYAVPTTNPLQDADGNETVAFTDFPVTNNSTVANTTPPVPASAMVPASGDRLTLVFNEDLDIAADRLPAADAFTVKANGGRVTVQSVAPGTGTDSLVLHLGDGAIGQGLTVTVGYDSGEAGTNPVRDADGDAAGTFTDFPVANYSTVEKPNTAPVFADQMPEFEFPENEPKGTDVGTPVTATDADGDELTYSLADTRYGGMFTIDEKTGQLRHNRTSPFDFEGTQQNPFAIRVAANDGRGGTAHVDVMLHITDEKEPPLAPEAPAVTRVRDDPLALMVTWKAPDNRGRPDIDGYELEFREFGTEAWKRYGEYTATETNHGSDPLDDESARSAKIVKLGENKEYEVQVRAKNADTDDDSPWSLPGKGRTPDPNAGVGGDLQLVVDSAGEVEAVDDDNDGHVIGRLEIFLGGAANGAYGTICDDRFNSKSFRITKDNVSTTYRNIAPDLACKLLKYEGGTFVTRRAAAAAGVQPATSSRRIWLDDVRCAENGFQDNTPVVAGEEVPLHRRCWHAGVGNNNCTHREDVHLQCRVEGSTPLALTAEFPNPPTTHDGSAFDLVIRFSEDVPASGRELHNAFDIVGGSISGVIRNVSEVGQDVHDEQERNDWTLRVEPEARGTNVTIGLELNLACDEPKAICTGDGRQLSELVPVEIASSQNQQVPPAALTARFRNAPATHDGTTPFTFRVEFERAPSI